MLWYLLYPFRGTTEPPRLDPKHPLRRAFQRYGTATAEHWLLSILLTVVVSVLLCYPVLFHRNSAAATRFRNLPKHVWTSTTEVEGSRVADVDMRQVWVHGDYMKAIDRRVLQQALSIQDTLIAHGFKEDETITFENEPLYTLRESGCAPEFMRSNSWGFHSPLMYWNCSPELLASDPDLLATINAVSRQQSFLNFTLRPSSLFAGKSFSNSKLQAADALVLTLLDGTNSSLGRIWDSRTFTLSQELPSGWSMYPQNGRVFRSRLYEFSFKPMTFTDDLTLAIIYFAMTTFVLRRMMKLRAVKSKFGLLLAIMFKLTVSVIASFTVCSFLQIKLTRIPREFFPFVVIVFGLGNVFRLMNEVLKMPPETPPVQRIGNAIGEVGHLSLAQAGQNLILLYLLSRFVVPGVSEFCAFAAVTLVLDFVFHLTFFLAVLSVDVQRMELQDSLERVDLAQASVKSSKPERQSWLDALRQGQVPFSTRLAGSAALVSFIMALNWHFFDNESQTHSLRRFLGRLFAKQSATPSPSHWTPPPINQARTPAEWLGLQDHHTAKEMITFIKPGASSFVARVYDPLIVFMNDADGRNTIPKRETWLQFLRHLAHLHFFPAALIVVFTIAFVTLLMNYLLWNGGAKDIGDETTDEAVISIKTLPMSHTLDVARLTSSAKGQLVSTSLDRSTTIWYPTRTGGYTTTTLQTAALKPKLWPIVASTIDCNGRLLALCTDGGQLGFWDLTSRRFITSKTVDLRGQTPILFKLASRTTDDYGRLVLFVITPDGYLTEIDPQLEASATRQLSTSTLLSASIITSDKGISNVVYVSKSGKLRILALNEANAISEVVDGLETESRADDKASRLKSVNTISSFGLIFAIRNDQVDILEFGSRALVHAFPTEQIRPGTFRVMHSARRLCTCGAPAIRDLSIAYTNNETNQLVLHSFTVNDTTTSQICLGKPSESNPEKCLSLNRVKASVHYVDSAGVWEATNLQSIIGIRKISSISSPSSTASGADTASYATLRARPTTMLFPGLDSLSRTIEPRSPSFADSWEVYTLSSTGEFHSRPLTSDDLDEDAIQPELDEQLFITSSGPITKLGKRSVAVGFGNTVKVVSLGKDWFEGVGDESLDVGTSTIHKSRIRKGTGRKMQ